MTTMTGVSQGVRGGASSMGRSYRFEWRLPSVPRSARPGPRGWSWRRAAMAMRTEDAGPDVDAAPTATQENQNDREHHGHWGGAGAAVAPVRVAPGVPVPHIPGPGGDADSSTGRPESRLHVFALRVPFPTALEAEIACASLAPDTEPHRAAVDKELTVIGRVLAVRWRAEDCRLLRIAVTNFLDQLSLVVRTMQRFGPPVMRQL